MTGEEISKVKLEIEKDMIFKCDMGLMNVKDFYIDEKNKDEAKMLGPNPARLLAAAVLGCMSASFIFCLQKKQFTLDDLKAEAEIIIVRNEKKLSRVKEINIKLVPITSDPAILKRINQCSKFFEQYCTITESVRAGIQVNLDIKPTN